VVHLRPYVQLPSRRTSNYRPRNQTASFWTAHQQGTGREARRQPLKGPVPVAGAPTSAPQRMQKPRVLQRRPRRTEHRTKTRQATLDPLPLRGLHTEPPFHGARNPPIWCHTRSGVHQHYPQQCGGAGDCVPLDPTATLHSTGSALSDKANDDDTLPSSALYSVLLGRVTLDNDTRAIRDASRSTPPQPHPTVMLDQFILLSNISPHLSLSAPQDPPSPCHD